MIERGHQLRVTTRTPVSPAAKRLENLGAEIVPADYEESGSLAAAEVAHLVFVSGDGAAPDSPLPLFRAKWEVEEAIRGSGVPHTILAPTHLMENLFNPWNIAALRAGVLPSPIPVNRPLQQTAVADLLSVAVLALEQPDRFAARRIALASDEPTALDAAEVISDLIPRTLEARQATLDELPQGVRLLFGWLQSTGHHVDIGALHRNLPEVGWHDYAAWVGAQLDRLSELCPPPGATVQIHSCMSTRPETGPLSTGG